MDMLMRERGYAAQPLQEIESHSFTAQKNTRRTAHFGKMHAF